MNAGDRTDDVGKTNPIRPLGDPDMILAKQTHRSLLRDDDMILPKQTHPETSDRGAIFGEPKPPIAKLAQGHTTCRYMNRGESF
jgi:hypothetical protein